MKKNLGIVPAIYPMPVLIIAAYNEDGTTNAMNAAWGTVCDGDKIVLFISEHHKTTQNILRTGAFTVSLADRPNMVAADYFGIASGNNVPDKFARSGMTSVPSDVVNAPILAEFPVVMECELADVVQNEHFYSIVGRVKNTQAEESVLDEDGTVNPAKTQILMFDKFQHGYYVTGEKAGQAWDAGVELMEK